ncbi:hypothetical protein [Kribbella sp. NPDC051718]|uniref:hypothetical protein n=1 Tax=Kribbella sp. NPDC051718 TaxID=3155168 RepID=UPI00341B1A3A
MSERVFFTRHALLAAGMTIGAALLLAGIVHADRGKQAGVGPGLTPVAGKLPVAADLPIVAGMPADADGDEGSSLATHGSFTNGPGTSRLKVTLSSGAGTVTDNGDGTWSWSYTSGDDASGIVVVKATDGKHAAAIEAFGWTAANVAPTLGHLRGTRRSGNTVSVNAPYSDPGTTDTHTAFVRWGDGSTTLARSATGAVTGSHDYASTGPHRIAISVVDDDDGRVSAQFELRQ